MRTTSPAFAIAIGFALGFTACQKPIVEQEDMGASHIKVNQLGYYPGSIKEVLVTDMDVEKFCVLNFQGRRVYRGRLHWKGRWEASGEDVLQGDFSRVKRPGRYTILLENGLGSLPFEIREKVYEPALNASIKSYYFQRASMPIEVQYGDIFERAGGHFDMECPFHPSSGHEEGCLRSPGGWYDAGDYGKYTVNAAMALGQMLSLLEIYPEAIPDGRLNIPESGNGRSDLLDELRYELDWLVTMQDMDGGVFHKLSSLEVCNFVMPEDDSLTRYIIGKGTFATLSYAAVLAQAARVFETSDPEWARALVLSARSAWNWARRHPDVIYLNPPDVTTGEYGDDDFDDDFYRAAAELFLTTGEEEYLNFIRENPLPYEHLISTPWKFYARNMGFHSLLINRDRLPGEMAQELCTKHLALADTLLQAIKDSPYGISLDHFEWGSNSDLLNQAQILCIAHHLSAEKSYLNGALRNTDYIFGKNACGYSFLTGFGSKQVMNPHHRPSGADHNVAPVPGLVTGGPNKAQQDRQYLDYQSELPAKAFEDVQASFASNEVCLNRNASAVFVLAYLEACH